MTVMAAAPPAFSDPYRWVILAVGVAGQAAFAAVTLGLPAVAAAVRAHYGLSIEQVGIALGATTAGMVLTMFGWGALADRIGERAVITVGLSGAAAVLLVAARVDRFVLLTAALALAGGFGASVNAASGRAVMGWFGPAERGVAMGIRQTAIPLGGALAAITLPALADGDDAPRVLVALAGFCLVAAVAVGVCMRRSPEAAELRRAADPSGPDGAAAAGSPRHPLRDPHIWRISAASFLLVIAQIAQVGFIALYLHDERGLSITVAGVVLAAVQLGGVLARIGFGRLADRRQERLPLLTRLALALVLASLLAAGLLGAADPVTVVALGIAGVLGLSWNGLAFLATAEAAPPARRGAALGVQNTVVALSAALTPVGFAALVGAAGWAVAYAALPVAASAAVAVLLPLARAERADRAEAVSPA